MRGVYFLIVVAVLALGVLYMMDQKGITFSSFFVGERNVITIGEVQLEVEVVDSLEGRRQGLSGRKDIGEGVVGLFMVFDESGYHAIWMKDMHFSIDIVWISEEGSVVHIERGVAPDTYPRIFEPSRPARYVLETERGFVEVYGFSVGDRVTIPGWITAQ